MWVVPGQLAHWLPPHFAHPSNRPATMVDLSSPAKIHLGMETDLL